MSRSLSPAAATELWVPVHPRLLPALRVIGGVGLCFYLFKFVVELQQLHSSLATAWTHQLSGLLLPLWLLTVPAVRHPRTFWSLTLTVVHWALIVAMAVVFAFVLVPSVRAFLGNPIRH